MDDLILISRTKKQGMECMLRTVHRFCRDMKMKLAVEKTILLQTGPELDLEAVILAKNLGVDIQVKGRNLRKEKNLP